MNANECPVCRSKNVKSLESIEANSLADAYQKNFGISIARFFSDNRHLVTLRACGTCDLRWYTPMVCGDASFYEDLQRHAWYYQDVKPEYEFARTKVGPSDSVLEVGCGKGAFRRFLPAGVRYRGLEFNTTAVAAAKLAGLSVDIESIDAHSAINPNTYDFVCHFQVLEHVPDPFAFLVSCVAAVKPGGTMIVAVPAEDSFLSVVEDGWLNMPPHHLTRWTDSSLTSVLEALGLESVELWHEPVASYHGRWYATTMTCLGFKNLLGIRTRLKSDRFYSRIAKRLERVPGVGSWLRRRGASSFLFSSNGHTVCASARKPIT
jgi:SAM-dependent methyltransferase